MLNSALNDNAKSAGRVIVVDDKSSKKFSCLSIIKGISTKGVDSNGICKDDRSISIGCKEVSFFNVKILQTGNCMINYLFRIFNFS